MGGRDGLAAADQQRTDGRGHGGQALFVVVGHAILAYGQVHNLHTDVGNLWDDAGLFRADVTHVMPATAHVPPCASGPLVGGMALQLAVASVSVSALAGEGVQHSGVAYLNHLFIGECPVLTTHMALLAPLVGQVLIRRAAVRAHDDTTV